MTITTVQTPSLLIDLDALEQNIETAARRYRATTCKIRPHVKNHRSPHIAHLQIEAGGTVGGVCVSNVAEAEAMVSGGIRSVLVTNQSVTDGKVRRLCALAAHAEIIVACDNRANAELLSHIARDATVDLGVVIEVDTGLERAGVQSPRDTIELAESITRLPNLKFRGLMSHEAAGGATEYDERKVAALDAIGRCLEIRKAVERAGIEVEIVSAGETWNWDIVSALSGVTEVQLGSYALMSAAYSYMSAFRIAVSVIGTVTCVPEAGIAVGNVGARCLGLNAGCPVVIDPAGVRVREIDDDRVSLRWSSGRPRVGDRFRIVPGSEDTMVNRWNQYLAVRDDKVEAIWEISARGASG